MLAAIELREREVGAEKFQIRANKLMKAAIIEYDQSLVGGRGRGRFPPVAA
jgi:hypothetical protein